MHPPLAQPLPAPFFFSHHFFLIPATGKPPKKYLFIFHFPIEPNKFIKIYFFYLFFFSSFTHCKTSKKISSYHFFSYVLFTKHTITQFIQHMITQFIHNNSCYAHHSHIKHNACSFLILSRDCLGNHIPKL